MGYQEDTWYRNGFNEGSNHGAPFNPPEGKLPSCVSAYRRGFNRARQLGGMPANH